MNFQVFFREFLQKEGYKLFLQGLYTTLLIAILGLIIGFLLGTLLAIFKLLPGKGGFTKFLKGFTNVYITLFRGTPMVVQLLLFHFVIFPAMSIHIPPLIEGVIAFGMNHILAIFEFWLFLNTVGIGRADRFVEEGDDVALLQRRGVDLLDDDAGADV